VATLKQANKLLELVIQKETPSEQLQTLYEGGYLADLLDANLSTMNREAFRKFCGLGQLMPDLMELNGIILPEQSVTFGDRITKGAYDWKNDDLTEKRYPLTLSAGPRNLVLAHFNKVMTSKQVEAWASENGYEVALIDDLLAVGSHSEYKELQRKFPIIALGSSAVVGGRRHVPDLSRSDSRRFLYLLWYFDAWRGGCRFLLRKVS
ncbi:MAG: hypothetical protein ABIP54_00115, partial [Candidatus Andersenbacteria bacterium]